MHPHTGLINDKVRALQAGRSHRKGKEKKPFGAGAHFGGRVPQGTQWAAGLSPEKQHEWLVDCYRMRTDDLMVWGGGLTGLYCRNATKGSVLRHFLVFCKLAVAHGVIPHGWDWPAFLRVAAGLLRFAFEKEDAHAKWGGENVFSAMMGGRSLRYTGEVVYRSSVTDGGRRDVDERRMHQELEGRDWADLIGSPIADSVFRSVGGVAAWQELYRNMPDL
jgi:hypothetical protein